MTGFLCALGSVNLQNLVRAPRPSIASSVVSVDCRKSSVLTGDNDKSKLYFPHYDYVISLLRRLVKSLLAHNIFNLIFLRSHLKMFLYR